MKNINYKEKLYDNLPVYHPTGKLMFRADRKRYNWYLSRDLAKPYNDGIMLTFEPGGLGEPIEILEHKDSNVCVVCETADRLTSHHVVPYSFMKFFGSAIKDKNRYNLLPVCRGCHDEYESKTVDFRNGILDSTPLGSISDIVSMYTICWNGWKSADRMSQHFSKMPKDRVEFMTFNEKYYDVLCREIMLAYGIEDRLKPNDFKENLTGRVVLDYGYTKLAKMWSAHFVETMSPKNMPGWWDLVYSQDNMEDYIESHKQSSAAAVCQPMTVYLVKSVSRNGEVAYKIGVTSRPIQTRIKELATANPAELILEASVESEYAYKIESMMHRRFKRSKIAGEWFSDEVDPAEFLMAANSAHVALDSCKKNGF